MAAADTTSKWIGTTRSALGSEDYLGALLLSRGPAKIREQYDGGLVGKLIFGVSVRHSVNEMEEDGQLLTQTNC